MIDTIKPGVSESTASWETMPIEIRMQIIRWMNCETRKSFRNCSHHCRELVNATKLRSIPKIYIKNYYGWMINVIKNGGKVERKKDMSFEEAQEFMDKLLKNIDYVECFLVCLHDISKPLRLQQGGLKVEELMYDSRLSENYSDRSGSDMAMLNQFDPDYISRMEMLTEYRNPIKKTPLYDTPHLIKPIRISIPHATIRDDQLIKLNATYVEISEADGLTGKGIAQYVRKCLKDLNTKNYEFSIHYKGPPGPSILKGFSRSKVEKANWNGINRCLSIVNSPHKAFQLRITERNDNHGKIQIYGNRIRKQETYFEKEWWQYECP